MRTTIDAVVHQETGAWVSRNYENSTLDFGGYVPLPRDQISDKVVERIGRTSGMHDVPEVDVALYGGEDARPFFYSRELDKYARSALNNAGWGSSEDYCSGECSLTWLMNPKQGIAKFSKEIAAVEKADGWKDLIGLAQEYGVKLTMSLQEGNPGDTTFKVVYSLALE